ncbi:MAG TPA: hypothetical protein VFA33_14475 [Bryobacteraceae bacterium]|nr:hypothetical protein [Bryobacteraceae bacterium]
MFRFQGEAASEIVRLGGAGIASEDAGNRLAEQLVLAQEEIVQRQICGYTGIFRGLPGSRQEAPKVPESRNIRTRWLLCAGSDCRKAEEDKTHL